MKNQKMNVVLKKYKEIYLGSFWNFWWDVQQLFDTLGHFYVNTLLVLGVVLLLSLVAQLY